ncbi:MAG: NAD(P)H-binding protein [Rhizonema sp. PD37]|nr:NAD(P)H-binding protein [Rhizonema sp. PD37]
MRVFITGGTGTIGTPVVAELLGNGHSVLALARSDASTQTLKQAGAEVLRGGLADLDVLRSGAARSDGVISLAFGRDYETPEALARSIAEESTAMTVLGNELTGSDRPIVAVSGTPWVPGHISTELDPLPTEGPVGGRVLSQLALLDLASRGVRSATIRLPRTVHNEGKGGFAGLLTDIARRTGVSGYPGDGTQRWPAVHALDATVIGRRLDLPVQEVPEEDFGPFGPIFALDQPASSALTRDKFGWTPTHKSLLEDLENIQP